MNCQFNFFIKITGYFLLLIVVVSCKKDWLDAKPEKSLVVPSKISDYQAMLDNPDNGSAPFNVYSNVLGEIGAGDFYVSNDAWAASTPLERNTYIWNADIYGQDKSYEIWEAAYNNILYCNVILEGIEKIVPTNNAEAVEWNQVKGSALFFRAYRHFDIAQVFCKPYDKNLAKTDLGIPLRLRSDISIVSKRATVEETYQQITDDLKEAASLLPLAEPINVTYKVRPTKSAAYAMLARTYLAMALYDSSLVYANKSLQLYDVLLDYGLSPGGPFSIPIFNDEVIFHIAGAPYPIVTLFNASVDPSLYNSYDIDDRRRDMFWFELDGTPRFVGSYTGDIPLFTGLATDEVYLIRAECNARAGNVTDALLDLNAVIEKRWNNTVPYPTITASDASDALRKILEERRKELCFRGIRWSDLRRLNKETQFAVTLTREINGTTYSLTPNSQKYVLPIPPDVIEFTGMEQNPR